MANPEIRFKKADGTDYPDWKTTAFEKSFSAVGNNTLSRSELSESGTVRNVHYGDILTILGNIVDPETDNLPFIEDEAKAEKYLGHVLKDGDVIFADTAEDDTVGKAIEMKNCEYPVVSGLHTTPCRPTEGLFEHGYLGYYLNAPAYHNQLRPLMQGIKVTSVSRTSMKETELNHPTSSEEQKKIAALFTELDDLISATSDEVASLEEAKKGMVQKIFNQEIRFKRDDGTKYPDWKKTKLSDIAKRITRKNSNNETDIPLTIASLNGLVDQRTYFGKTIASVNMSGYYLIKRGEFAYNKSYSKGFDFGAIKRLDDYDQGALSTLYICFALNDKINSDYMVHYFDSQNWNREVSYRCAEGARNHGLLNISATDFFDISLLLSVDKEEQQKIAEFLSSMDNAISAARGELAGYKELKKGLLQKMFA